MTQHNHPYQRCVNNAKILLYCIHMVQSCVLGMHAYLNITAWIFHTYQSCDKI